MKTLSKTIWLVLVHPAAVLLSGCGPGGREGSPATSLPPISVRLAPVQTGQHLATEDVVGTVRARVRAAVEAKINARIEDMAVTLGQSVKAGELLVRLDARDLEAKLDQAKAVFAQAERDLERLRTLVNQGAVTQQEFDAVQARYRVAQAGVSEAETMLGYARVVAPFDGVITRKLADIGDLAAPGRALLQIEAPDSLRFEADVSEALIGKIKIGQQLEVRVASVAGPLAATVSEVAPAADPATRTFLVKLDLPAAPGLRAGQFGRVTVPVSESSVLTVPATAVIQRGQLEYVVVAAGDRAQLRIVKTGKHDPRDIEILSGLDAGEKVIVGNAAEVRDGQPLRIQP